jgi:predicted transcriptional regulator
MSTHYREISHCELRLQLAEKGIENATAQRNAELIALGRALRAAREAKGISLRHVATALGLSAPFISDCELGRRALSAAHRGAYLKLLRPLLSIK